MSDTGPDDGGDSNGETVSPGEELDALTRALDRISTAANATLTAEYNGRTMTVEHAAVLESLLDKFKFAVQPEGVHPNIEPVAQFSKLPMSTSRPQLNPRAGYARFYAGVTYKYTVEDHQAELPFIMVEQALIDMKTKVNSNGTPVSRYGTGWVNVGVPIDAFKSICNRITEKTGYAIDDSNFNKTTDDKYVTTVASINERKRPEMVMIQSDPLNPGTYIKYRLGDVGDAYANEDVNDVAIGFITFSLGLNCELPLGEESVPSDALVRLKFKLGPSRLLAAAPANQLDYFNVNSRFDYY